ncbi:MAG: hypothetical protein ACI37Q_01925, partial [Candidatus Gastranaerophilaceae bacterium]
MKKIILLFLLLFNSTCCYAIEKGTGIEAIKHAPYNAWTPILIRMLKIISVRCFTISLLLEI